jgi:hypothetical protein
MIWHLVVMSSTQVGSSGVMTDTQTAGRKHRDPEASPPFRPITVVITIHLPILLGGFSIVPGNLLIRFSFRRVDLIESCLVWNLRPFLGPDLAF